MSMDVLARVGSSRMMLEGKFPYPSAVDCMRYAIQEMAEYDDAMMRQDQPDHKRNNERQPDPRRELGQAGFMLLSAYLYFEQRYPLIEMAEPCDSILPLWSVVVMNTASAISFAIDTGTHEWAAMGLNSAWCQCAKLMRAHGWDVDDLIAETCEAFEAKHLGVTA